MVVDVGPERRRDDAAGLDAREEIRVDQRAVLDAMPAVGVGPLLQRPLVGLQHHVDGHVAVGVDADLEAVACASSTASLSCSCVIVRMP